MKNKSVIFLLSAGILLTICSCNNINNQSSENNESVSSSSTTSEYLNLLEEYKDTINKMYSYREDNKNLYSKNKSGQYDKKIDENSRKFYEDYSNLIAKVQSSFKEDKTIRNLFVEEYGEEETKYIENIDVNKIFVNRELPKVNIEQTIQKGKDIISSLNTNNDVNSLYQTISEYNNEVYEMNNASYIYNIYMDLYADNLEYTDTYTEISTALNTLSNDTKVIFKNLLSNDKYINSTKTYFGLSDEDVAYYLNSTTYSDEIIALMDEETNLIGKYNENATATKMNSLYLELVNKRREIATALGYDSYLDYAYKELYTRQYTVADANNLLINIANNTSLKNSYRNAGSNAYSATIVGENDLISSLDYVENVVPEAKEVIKDLKTYGNYSYEYRQNKYGGSYETTLSNDGSAFYMFVSASGAVTDYPTVFHEFGHYLSSNLHPEEVNEGLNLDLAEIDSQGLEYLMNNYYREFLSSTDAKYIIEEQILSALWTIMSGSAITKLENYVYTTKETLTTALIQSKFNECIRTYVSPYSFGYSGNNFYYHVVPHIYQAPGYYISYITSVIPSLEIWADDSLEEAIKKYNKVLSYGSYGNFIDALNDAGLNSPFEKEAINKIADKIAKSI